MAKQSSPSTSPEVKPVSSPAEPSTLTRPSRIRKQSERGIIYAQARQQQHLEHAQRLITRRRRSDERKHRGTLDETTRGNGSCDASPAHQTQEQDQQQYRQYNPRPPTTHPAHLPGSRCAAPHATQDLKRVWVCDKDGQRRSLANEDLRAALALCTLSLCADGVFHQVAYREVVERSRVVVAGWRVERVEWAGDSDRASGEGEGEGEFTVAERAGRGDGGRARGSV